MGVDKRLLKEFVSLDGKRSLELYARSDGLFDFQEFYEDTDDMRHLGWGTYTFIAPGQESGLFDNAEAAEREARSSTPWLRQNPT